jgi:hypothetical protein
MREAVDMHTAIGDARRAEQVATMMRNQFAQVAERLLTIPAKEPQGASGTGDRELRDPRLRAIDGMAAPGTRSPVPNMLLLTTRKTPAAPRERDGRGRE